MSYIKRQYNRLQDYMLERKLQQTNIRRQPKDYKSAQKIGLLFNATDQQHRQTALAYAKTLETKGKKVQLLAFYDEKNQQPNFTFKHFSRKELNFLRRPKGPVVHDFMSESFDVLINLFLEEEPALEYISALSQAQLRVGPYTEHTYCYDLMIDTTNRQDLQRYIEQIEFLLNKMNTTPQEPTMIK